MVGGEEGVMRGLLIKSLLEREGVVLDECGYPFWKYHFSDCMDA